MLNWANQRNSGKNSGNPGSRHFGLNGAGGLPESRHRWQSDGEGGIEGREAVLVLTCREIIAAQVSRSVQKLNGYYLHGVWSKLPAGGSFPGNAPVILFDLMLSNVRSLFSRANKLYPNSVSLLISEELSEKVAVKLLISGARGCIDAGELSDLPDILESIRRGGMPVPAHITARLINVLRGEPGGKGGTYSRRRRNPKKN